MRYIGYFSLYVFLLITTIAAIFSYRYAVRKHKYNLFFWLRRIYALCLVIWIMGITYLESSGGKGVSSYYYFIPTTAAMLLLNPVESFVIFGGTWCGLAFIFLNFDANISIFGNLMNSVFVTILSWFISYRYYKSTAIEYCDRVLIEKQYEEIENKNNLLLELVQRDQLTSLYNRHYLNQYFYSFFEQAQKNHYYGMFVMLDIDFFKQYNDLYGHLCGDECLKSIAMILNDECENIGASAIRYGGEEFLAIKLSQDHFDVQSFVNQLTSSIKNALLYRSDIDPYYVTVSIGIWCGFIKNVTSIEEVIRKADISLYDAKSHGRNCAIFSSDSLLEINQE